MHRFSTQLQLLYPTFPLLWSMAYKQLECDLLLWGSRAIYGCVSYWRIAGRVYPKGKHSLAEGENRRSPLLSLVPSSLFHVILPSVPSGHPLSLFLLSLSPCLSPAIPTGASHYYHRSSLSLPSFHPVSPFPLRPLDPSLFPYLTSHPSLLDSASVISSPTSWSTESPIQHSLS